VYVFVKKHGTWTDKASLTASDGSTLNAFGSPIALTRGGDTALSGVENAAYVFQQNESQNTLPEEAKLGADIAGRSSAFAFSVDIDAAGRTVMVGDRGIGKAYLFKRHEHMDDILQENATACLEEHVQASQSWGLL
jgi:hypothetical protein